MTNAFAGDQLVFTLTGIDQQVIAVGDVLCDPDHPVPTTTRFQAHVVVFAVQMPITRGLPVVMHQQSLVEPAVIKKLIAQLHKGTGEVVKKKPRCLPKNSSAIVEIETQRPVCMELYRDVKQLGRVMLRVGGSTVAAGLVTKVFIDPLYRFIWDLRFSETANFYYLHVIFNFFFSFLFFSLSLFQIY